MASNVVRYGTRGHGTAKESTALWLVSSKIFRSADPFDKIWFEFVNSGKMSRKRGKGGDYLAILPSTSSALLAETG